MHKFKAGDRVIFVHDFPYFGQGTNPDKYSDYEAIIYDINADGKYDLLIFSNGQGVISENYNEKWLISKYITQPTKNTHNNMYCNCVEPMIVLSHSSCWSKIDNTNSYKYCKTCKKERL